MNKKMFFLFFTVAVVIEFILLYLKINFIVSSVIMYIIILSSYLTWWFRKNKKINNILEEKCDPELFIERYEKEKLVSKRPAFQNLCNINIAVGMNSLGQNAEAISFLSLEYDHGARNSKIMKAGYHLTLFSCYLNMGDLENAGDEYNNHIKAIRNTVLAPNMIFALDASVYEYMFMINRTDDTAKVFMDQLDYLYSAYSKKLSKRSRLNVLYNKAEIMSVLGDKEKAAVNYKIVAEEGNKLWIAEKSRQRLAETGMQHENI